MRLHLNHVCIPSFVCVFGSAEGLPRPKLEEINNEFDESSQPSLASGQATQGDRRTTREPQDNTTGDGAPSASPQRIMWVLVHPLKGYQGSSAKLGVGDILRLGMCELRIEQVNQHDREQHIANMDPVVHDAELLSSVSSSSSSRLTSRANSLRHNERDSHEHEVPAAETDTHTHTHISSGAGPVAASSGTNLNTSHDGVPAATELEWQQHTEATQTHTHTPQATQRTCRFCLGGEGEGEGEQPGLVDPLISVCSCRGSLEGVHLSCLRLWMQTKLHMRLMVRYVTHTHTHTQTHTHTH